MLDPSTLRLALNILLLVALGAAVVVDGRTRRIPNLLTVPFALAGMVLHTLASGVSGLGDSVGGLFLGMGMLLPVFMASGTGAGDVKLLGMVGALGGIRFVFWTALLGAVVGGVLALIAITIRGNALPVLRNVGAFFFRVLVLRGPGGLEPSPGSFRMRYAVVIALGALAAALRQMRGL